MTMKLLGRLSSINVRKVMWTARLLGLDLGEAGGELVVPAQRAQDLNGVV